MSRKNAPAKLVVESHLPGPLRMQIGDEKIDVKPGKNEMEVGPELRTRLAQFGDRIRLYAAA